MPSSDCFDPHDERTPHEREGRLSTACEVVSEPRTSSVARLRSHSVTRLRPCLTCGRPTRSGARCADHAVNHGYSSTHWQTVRAARLEIDGHRCQLRHLGCSERATSVHLHPDERGDHALASIYNTKS